MPGDLLCPPDPLAVKRAKHHMFLHGMLTTDGVSTMGEVVALLGLPCDWAQFFYIAPDGGIEQQTLAVMALWYRECPPMIWQLYMNHGHLDEDALTGMRVCSRCQRRMLSRESPKRLGFSSMSWKQCMRLVVFLRSPPRPSISHKSSS